MAEHINFLLLGLGNGAVFAALALALVVTYRSSGVLNFATGALALHGAYTYAYLRQGRLLNPIPPFASTVDLGRPLSFAVALVVTLLIEALVGVVLHVAIFRLLRNAVPAAKAVASLGVMVLLTALVAQQAGSDQVLVAQIFPSHSFTFGDVRIVGDRVWFAATIVGIALLLAAIYRFTSFGLATRAASETEIGALVSSVSPERIAMVNWAISSMVAGLAGVLIAPLTPLLPGTYTLFIVPALAAAVLGRFSSLAPAVLGGLALGMLQSEAVFLRSDWSFLPKAGTAELIPLAMVLLVLVVRGKPLPSRGMLVQQTLGRAPRPHGILVPLAVSAPLAVLALYGLEGSIRAALIYSFVVAILALSLVVVTGYAGQISLAQLTLAGAAGFLLSPLTTSWHVPFPIAPVLAALGATAIGVVVGLPALRIRGLLVGVVTLTLAVALEAVWFRNNDLNGGSSGARVAVPKLFGVDLGIGAGAGYPRPAFGLLCLAVLVVVAIGVARLRTSRLGSAMLAVRANERSAAAVGISVVQVKLLAFAIGAFIAGLGGSLLAYKQGRVTFESFSALGGLDLFTTTYLTGITSVAGGLLGGVAIAGGLFFVLLDRHVHVGNWFSILSGLGVVVTVIRNPEGLVGPAHAAVARWRARRLAAPVGAAPPRVAAPGTSPADVGSAAPLLRVDDLVVRYGGVTAVGGISFDVREGSITGLIGPNGAGKTTTMDALCGFAPYGGTVVLDGAALDGLPPHRRARRGLARTFQALDLYDDLTVVENVVVGEHVSARRPFFEPNLGRQPRFGSKNGGRDRGERDLDLVFDKLGLGPLRDLSVRELSQGQRQLVSVARALVSRPRLLLLDEPAGGLDTTESLWLADRLREVRAAGTTILLIDHDMSLVLGLCDVIHVMDFGRMIASGPPDAVRADAKVTEAYLGSTHTEATVAR